MYRKENDLLESLFNVMSSVKNENNVNLKDEDIIEKYRDEDGFINVKNVKDINELKRIFDIVDNKNYIESISKSKNLQDIADKLADDLSSLSENSVVNVKLETPSGMAYKTLNKTKPFKEPVCKFNELNEKTKEKVNNKTNTAVDVKTNEPTEYIVLHDVGCSYNYAFYNAVLYICQHKHFNRYKVLSDDYNLLEGNPESPNKTIKKHILLPNAFEKISEWAASTFSEKINNGEEVYIIYPETFALKKIETSLELYTYSMTRMQEELMHNI